MLYFLAHVPFLQDCPPEGQASRISVLHAACGLDRCDVSWTSLSSSLSTSRLGELLHVGEESWLAFSPAAQATRWRHFPLVLRDHGNEETLWLATAGVSKRQTHGRYEMKNDLCTKEARTSKSACGTRTCRTTHPRSNGVELAQHVPPRRNGEMHARGVFTSHSSRISRHFLLLPCR
jgi:hypothetical protein